MLKVTANGVQVTTGAASATTAIPNDSGGNRARYVRLQVLSGNCYVLPGSSATVATTGSMLLNPNEDIILDVTGCTHIAAIQGAAAEKFNITPLESPEC